MPKQKGGESLWEMKALNMRCCNGLHELKRARKAPQKQCIVCQPKIDRLEIQVAHLESALQSAQERLNVMQVDRNELKKDLTDAIKEQISGIYRMAAVWLCGQLPRAAAYLGDKTIGGHL